MSIKTPLTSKRVKNHFAYGFWKYLILIVAAVAGWNLIYQTTQYRPPEDKRIDFYVASNTMDSDAMDTWLADVRKTAFPDLELIEAYTVMTGTDDPYAQMQLSTFIMAGEGDVYMLDAERFKSYAAEGAMAPLENYVADGSLNSGGLDVSGGYVTESDTGGRHLLGIPADKLYGLINHFGIDCRGMVLCVMVRSGNEKKAVKFIDYLIQNMQEPAPDWLAPLPSQP
jgi:hypothetical protein